VWRRERSTVRGFFDRTKEGVTRVRTLDQHPSRRDLAGRARRFARPGVGEGWFGLGGERLAFAFVDHKA
jgi:hypothetical protein